MAMESSNAKTENYNKMEYWIPNMVNGITIQKSSRYGKIISNEILSIRKMD